LLRATPGRPTQRTPKGPNSNQRPALETGSNCISFVVSAARREVVGLARVQHSMGRVRGPPCSGTECTGRGAVGAGSPSRWADLSGRPTAKAGKSCGAGARAVDTRGNLPLSVKPASPGRDAGPFQGTPSALLRTSRSKGAQGGSSRPGAQDPPRWAETMRTTSRALERCRFLGAVFTLQALGRGALASAGGVICSRHGRRALVGAPPSSGLVVR